MPLTGLSQYLHVCTTNETFFLKRIRYTCVANFLFSPGGPGRVPVPYCGGPGPDPAGEAGDLLGRGRPAAAAAAAVTLVPGHGGGSAATIRVEDVLQGDLRTKKEKNA